MKNRYLLFIFFILATMMLCLAGCGQKAESSQQNAPAETVRFERIWEHDEELNQDFESAIIMGMDTAGEVVWTHVTDQYSCGQSDVVEEVLTVDNQFIMCEDGALVSLDIPTGEILWKNTEFKGYGGAFGVAGNNGSLYFCGYLGTSFCAVDREGNTLHKIESFGRDYTWAHHIRIEGDKIAVPLGLGPEELRGPDGFVMLVDPDDYSFELQNPGAPEAEPVDLPALAGDIAQVLPMNDGAVAVLYTDGTVGVAGNETLAAEVSSWETVVQLYCGTDEGTLAARMADGTAVSTEFDLSGWNNLRELYFGYECMAGLTKDGAVVTAGSWSGNSPEGWTGIRELYLSMDAWGLKTDGSLICTDDTYYKEVASQKNVRQLLFGHGIYAVLEDGSIISGDFDESEFQYLRNAERFTVIDGWLFGLTADGRLVAQTRDGWVYNNGDYFTVEVRPEEDSNPKINLEDVRYQNIKALDYQRGLIMLKNDGSVDTVNVDYYWDLSAWDGIEKIVTAYADGWGQHRIYGIRADGSVIVADGDYQQTSVSTDHYQNWQVLELFNGEGASWDASAGVVGITPEGMLVGDGDYAGTDFGVLIR